RGSLIVWPGLFGSGIGPASFMQLIIIVGAYPVGLGGFTSPVEYVIPLNTPHWSEYTRETSFPAQSLKVTGILGGENFSPKVGAKGSNPDVKSSVMIPVNFEPMWVEVKM